MITDIPFKDFIDKLFAYTKVPLSNRGWITAQSNDNYPYCYTWGEIEDYINRWLKKTPINKRENEVQTAFSMMDKIIKDWYLLNFNQSNGRVEYEEDFDPYTEKLDREEFYLHTKIKEYIHIKAREMKMQEEKDITNQNNVSYNYDYYLRIITEGCTDPLLYKDFRDHLMAKYHQAKKDGITLNAFFNGCKMVVTKWKEEIKEKKSQRISELEHLIALSNVNIENNINIEESKKDIDVCKKELSNISDGRVGQVEYDIKLCKNGIVTKWLYFEDLRNIEGEVLMLEATCLLQDDTGKSEERKKEVKDFEEYLIGVTDKDSLLKKLSKLYITANPKNGFIIYRAMENLGYIQKQERGKQQIYNSINKKFKKNFRNQNYQGHFRKEKENPSIYSQEIKGMVRFLENFK